MKKLIKSGLNLVFKTIFLFVKSGSLRAKLMTAASRILFNRNNEVEFDAANKLYWLKHGSQYLYSVRKPVFNFSKKNLYDSILEIYCKKYTPAAGDTIVDVGAGIGTETLFFTEKTGGTGKIYSIEASTDSYNRLNALCEKNKMSTAVNFNIAISDSNGRIYIEETENFQVNQVNTQKKGIEIDCLTLDQFVKNNAIARIDFLKVNIEGSELQMIDGMKNAIGITRHIAVSCHDFLFKEDRKIKDKMTEFLTANGFSLYFNESGHPAIDSWVYGVRS